MASAVADLGTGIAADMVNSAQRSVIGVHPSSISLGLYDPKVRKPKIVWSDTPAVITKRHFRRFFLFFLEIRRNPTIPQRK
jgi:hypothetical protein